MRPSGAGGSVMITTEASPISWDCFAALERELEATLTFIELHKKNYSAVSDHYKSILVKACAEIEKIYTNIAGKALETKNNIAAYIQSITTHHEDFFHTEIVMPHHDDTLKPWQACAEGNDPAFWTTYHAIVHHGTAAKATLEDALHSMAGLFALMLAWD